MHPHTSHMCNIIHILAKLAKQVPASQIVPNIVNKHCVVCTHKKSVIFKIHLKKKVSFHCCFIVDQTRIQIVQINKMEQDVVN